MGIGTQHISIERIVVCMDVTTAGHRLEKGWIGASHGVAMEVGSAALTQSIGMGAFKNTRMKTYLGPLKSPLKLKTIGIGFVPNNEYRELRI